MVLAYLACHMCLGGGAAGGGSRGPDKVNEKIENGKFLREVQWFVIRCGLQRDQTDGAGKK